MHSEMWSHRATRRNLAALLADGVTIVGPASGPLAGGDTGPGRMVEPEEILAALEKALGGGALDGWKVLVTAGGTREPIDPVRFVGNRSSGKMGNAVAEEAAARGAEVTLVTAAEPPAMRGIAVVQVETAQEMAEAVWSRAGSADVAVLAAAVADFRPARPAEGKLRRADGPPDLVLEPTPDILAGVAAMSPRPFLVGFAAETHDLLANAAAKLKAKNLDLIVANDVSAPDAGFVAPTNRVTILDPAGGKTLAKMQFSAVEEGLGEMLRPPARAQQGNARSLPKHLQKPAAGPVQRNTVVIAGCEAHVCLLQTSLDLLEDEFDVWVVTDACGSRTERNRDAAFDRLAGAGAELVTTEMVAFEWLRGAEHPAFKDVLGLVK